MLAYTYVLQQLTLQKEKEKRKKENKEKNTSYCAVKGLRSQRNRFETQVPIVSNPRSRNSTISAITKRFTIRWHFATIVPFLDFHPRVCTSSISNRDSSKNTYSSDRVLFVPRFPRGFRLEVSFDECVRFSATSLKNGREACRHEHASIDHRSGNRATRWIPMIQPTSLHAESNTEGDYCSVDVEFCPRQQRQQLQPRLKDQSLSLVMDNEYWCWFRVGGEVTRAVSHENLDIYSRRIYNISKEALRDNSCFYI